VSRRRRLSIVLAISSAVVGAFFFWTQVVDPRLPREEAARQLRERLGVEWTFVCTPAGNDGTLPADIDYRCDPSRSEEIGYFIETDDSGIEIVARSG
jgi:hypothetical protein